MEAHILVREIRGMLADVHDQLLSHPFVAQVESGTLPVAGLRPFAGEQRHIISSDLSSVAELVARGGGDLFLEVLDGERAALGALEPFEAALGMSRAEVEAYEPRPGAQAYAGYMAWLGSHASPPEAAAAFLVNFEAWGENCGRLSRALTTRHGLRRDDVRFLDLFAEPAGGFEEKALAVIQEGLDRGVDPQRIRRAARFLQAYELMYWDTLAGR